MCINIAVNVFGNLSVFINKKFEASLSAKG